VVKAATMPGIRSVEVATTFDLPWTPARMTTDARVELGFGDNNRED
jgi:metal-sulfur cluster biosynthetic enzyme